MLPWRDVVAASSPRITCGRWCPHCLAEDRAAGATPYFRLAWDVGTVTACSRHQRRLVCVCRDCGATDIRQAAFIVPGWCASCGIFLGEDTNTDPATPGEIWIASQVSAILAIQNALPSAPTREALMEAIRVLVQRLDDGKSATFARRIGLRKTTVHHWLREGGVPTLPALLRIVSQTGLALPDLLTANLGNLPTMSAEIHDLDTLFPETKQRAAARRHDWSEIRATLAAAAESSNALSVTDIARSLNVNERSLYHHARAEAYAITELRKQQRMRRYEESLRETSELVEMLYPEIVAKGKAVNLREILAHIPDETSIKVRNLFQLLRDIKERNGDTGSAR